MEQLDTLGSQISFATNGSQYLTFRLGEEEYGVEILKVQEIKGYWAITPVPNTPVHLKGVMNQGEGVGAVPSPPEGERGRVRGRPARRRRVREWSDLKPGRE